MAKRVLFFAPHAFIWQHAYPEALVADALRSQDFEIRYITCGRALDSWCIAMESTGASEQLPAAQREAICKTCERHCRSLEGHFNFDSAPLASFLTEEDQVRIDETIRSLEKDTFLDFEIDGYPFGRMSLYNFTINRKKSFLDGFTSDEWRDFLRHVRSCLVSYFAGRNLLHEVSPDYIFFYSSSYSINLMVKLQADREDIPCFSVYAGLNWQERFQGIHISNDDSFSAYGTTLARWRETYREQPATAKGLASAETQQLVLLEGNHSMVYGGGNNRLKPEAMRNQWGIPAENKVIVLAASSSDELLAAQIIGALPEQPSMAFEDQLAWIADTITFVEGRPDLSLIIRVHPRDLPNQRETIASEHSTKLRSLLQSLPANVSVNWPEDGLSLSDWLEIMDLGLTSWSSAGKEFALWGLPNVSMAPELNFYPIEDLGYAASNRNDYFQAIETALASGWSWQRLLSAYRWSAYELTGSIFNLSDALPADFADTDSFITRVLNKLTGRRYGLMRQFWYHRKPLRQAALMAEKVETLKPSADILEQAVTRLSEEQEEQDIINLVKTVAAHRFGDRWQQEATQSKLRQNLLTNLS